MSQEQPQPPPQPPPQPQAQPQSGIRTASSSTTTTTRLPVSSSRRPNHQHHHHQRDRTSTVVRALAINESSGVPFGHVPAYLPGSSSLVEELDKRVLVVLRDGKHLIGTLASYDQFSNLVLLQTVERRIVRLRNSGDVDRASMMQCFYCDIPLGTFLVRGDSMVLMGAVEDDDDDEDDDGYLRPVSTLAELAELQKVAESAIEWDFDGDLIA